MKILNMLWIAVASLCVGTVITQLVVALFLFPKLTLDKERLSLITTIAQGGDIPTKEAAKAAAPESEQPSYQQVVEARAVKYRNLEIREQQLRNSIAQVQSEEAQVADDNKQFRLIHDSFVSQMIEMKKTTTSSGIEEVRRTLETIKPKQAKQLLSEMLDKKELDAVVQLLMQMPDKKRANIIGEFKTIEDVDKIAEVLRRLREGQPDIEAIENTTDKLKENTKQKPT